MTRELCQRKLVDGKSCRRKASDKYEIHVHHLIPRSEGGTDDPTNTVKLCRTCHFQIHMAAGDFKRWGQQGGKIGGPRTAEQLVSIPNLKQFQGPEGQARFFRWLCEKHPEKACAFFPTLLSASPDYEEMFR